MKYDFLKDTVNSITSLFDYLLINRELVIFCLLFIMYIIMYIRTIQNAVYLWNNSKEEEDSRSQKIKFIKPVVSTILSFAAIAFLYVGLSHFYINSNLTTETDEVFLVDKKFKGDKAVDDSSVYIDNMIKIISKKGYYITCFDGKSRSLSEVYFNYSPLKETIIKVDNDVFSNSNKFDKDPKNIRLKYYFYKNGNKIPRIIVVEPE